MSAAERIGEPIVAVAPGQLVGRSPDAESLGTRLVMKPRRAGPAADQTRERRDRVKPAGRRGGKGRWRGAGEGQPRPEDEGPGGKATLPFGRRTHRRREPDRQRDRLDNGPERGAE